MILALSDTHGNLPPNIPECNVLLIGGDVLPLAFDEDLALSMMWLDTNFRLWLEETGKRAKHIVGIAGSHDFIFEQDPEGVADLELPWTYLQDSGTEIRTSPTSSLKIWGLPWVPNLPYFAFHAPPLGLAEKYARIPEDIDIILSHCPPVGYCDNPEHPEWSTIRANQAIDRVRPGAFVCGHIHEGFGVRQYEGAPTIVYNVCYVDEKYRAQDRIVPILGV